MPKINTWEEGPDDGRYLSKTIETRTLLHLSVQNLVDGICSHYTRNLLAHEWENSKTEEGKELPFSLTESQILSLCREEIREWGTKGLVSWADYCGFSEEAVEWATGIIRKAMPYMFFPDGEEIKKMDS